MIKSYRDKATKQFAEGKHVKRFPSDINKRAAMRLARIDAAVELNDLRFPPSHNLEPLLGDREGQHSIRIINSGVFVLTGVMAVRLMLK